jgi:beta-phosphoglucomutase-like phosphatase (HAD superfamily)
MCPEHCDGGVVTAAVAVDGEPAPDLDHLTAHDLGALSAEEYVIVAIVAQLTAGDAAPVRAWAREGGAALERVREALHVLGELDRQLLVNLALDGLLGADASGRPSV